MNIPRFCLFIEEFFICKIKDSYYFLSKEGKEYVFLLEDNTEIKITEPKDENEIL